MLNKLKAFMTAFRGEKVVCAVSGGADSMALLWGLYLLKDSLELELSAAHFNHRLRDAESDRDEAFVREFCAGYGIDLAVGTGNVVPGAKGLEAAAREARYAFLRTLPGKIATAHTADDNAETLLMHMVRGTGLKGLGGIAPVNGNLIRPMLNMTRDEVIAFLQEYSVAYVEDSTNGEDAFLRNRIRHNVIPLLKAENPSLSQNLSAMALRLRQDEAALEKTALENMTSRVSVLRDLDPAIRSRVLSRILEEAGVKEPSSEHILALQKLVDSERPSARAAFPGGVTIARNYDALEVCDKARVLPCCVLNCPGSTVLEEAGVIITCTTNCSTERTADSFSVTPKGQMVVRSRRQGDTIRLSGGTKSLKKLFVDKKIPAHRREEIPVIADDEGVLAVVGIGANLDRISYAEDAVRIQIKYI